MKLAIIAAAALLIAGPCAAQCGGSSYGYDNGAGSSYGRSTYDPNTGNYYRTTPNPEGGATVRGNNLNTGSTWQTTIQPDGRERGTDSRGNTWNYNPANGSYSNSDGRQCFGKGMLRTCW